MTEFILLSISALFLAGTVFVAFSSWPTFGMMNVYTIMVSLYFGLYTIVDVFTVGVGNAVPEIALLAIGPILLTTVVAWLIYVAFPSNLKSELQLRNLMHRWVQAGSKGVMFAAIIAITFQVYVFATYGVVTYVYVDDLNKLGISIPSWIAPAKELSNSLAFCAILYYLTKRFLGEHRTWFDSLFLETVIERRKKRPALAIDSLLLDSGPINRPTEQPRPGEREHLTNQADNGYRKYISAQYKNVA